MTREEAQQIVDLVSQKRPDGADRTHLSTYLMLLIGLHWSMSENEADRIDSPVSDFLREAMWGVELDSDETVLALRVSEMLYRAEDDRAQV
jgi:hypothetical protein